MTTNETVPQSTEQGDLKFRLWSNKHGMWWRPDGWGYTPNIGEAGQFTESDAVRYVVNSALSGEVEKATVMVFAWPATEEPTRTLTAPERRAEQEYIAPVGVREEPVGAVLWPAASADDPNDEITGGAA